MVYLKVLDREKQQELQDLKCSDYLTFQDGKPVGDGAAQELLASKPDGVDLKNKTVFGIYKEEDHSLIGVIDIIKGYAGPETLSLGLMVIEPTNRGKGIGKEVIKKLENWAVGQKLSRIKLGVLFGNEKGLGFWKSVGFRETAEEKIKLYSNHMIRVMEKFI